MGETYRYVHDFKARKAEEVFDQLVSWLKGEGAKVTISQRPRQLEAIHGSLKALEVWKKTAEKKMSFTLGQADEVVNVILTMEPASKLYGNDVYVWRDKIQATWGQLAEEIWARVERSAPS